MPGSVLDNSLSWKAIRDILPDVLDEVSVRMINGTAKDALDYADSATGLKVIAIGGDKLSRGLTLEGLCTSYFLRSTRMYDTLMQMGRWFGYRPGYLDLCRLYTTDELIDWFEHITDASWELRDEFDMMVASGGTPRDYGLKVKSHPVLLITSRLKMRTARSMFLSFSGSVVETVSLFRDTAKISENLTAFNHFVKTLSKPVKIPPRKRGKHTHNWNGVVWHDVPWGQVTEFLNEYETHPEASKVNSKLIAEFIESMAKDSELTEWEVAVIGGGIMTKLWNIGGINVPMMKRSAKAHEDRYSIGRLLSPQDEGLDLDEHAWMAALSETREVYKTDPGRLKNLSEPDVPSGPSLRKVRGFGAEGVTPHPERGLLLIYLLDPESAGIEIKTTDPVVAFGISFPGSTSGTKVEYKVNNVMWEQWEQKYGSAE